MRGDDSDIWPVLSDDLLSGSRPIQRMLQPLNWAELYPAGELTAVADHIRRACGSWGGAFGPAVPFADEGMSSEWADLVARSRLEGVYTNGCAIEKEAGRERYGGGHWHEGEQGGDLLLEALALLPKEQIAWDAVHVADGIADDDPWFVSYAGTLGLRPPKPSIEDIEFSRLRRGLDYDDVVKIESCEGVAPSASDLLARLRRPRTTTAVQLTCSGWATFRSSVNSGIRAQDGPSDLPRHRRAAAGVIGPNIVVVYTPGSADDLALLWQLRAVHGLPSGFPLAVPTTEDVPRVVAEWVAAYAHESFGMGIGREWRFASMTVPEDELSVMAEATSNFTTGDLSEVLLPAPGCGVRTVESATFENGVATVAPVTANDRESLTVSVLQELSNRMEVTVSAIQRELPFSKTMHADKYSMAKYRDGVVLRVGRDRETLTVQLPTGLDVLDAVARDHGLVVRPSRPGLAGESFIRRIGGYHQLNMVAGHDGVELLRALTDRRGTRLIREGIRRVIDPAGEGVAEGEMAERVGVLETRVAGALGALETEDLKTLSHSRIASILGSKSAADVWITWALRCGLILRGVATRCEKCGRGQWSQMTALAHEMVCEGCAEIIAEPFKPSGVQFQYRAAHPLIQLMELDVLPHILAMKFLLDRYDSGFGRTSYAYGAYPGVEFLESATGAVVGECDVVLIFSDGRLGIGECKSRGGGLTHDELAKLVRMRDQLKAALAFVSTLDASSGCPQIWREARAQSVFALTAEHLFDRTPFASLGGPDPLEWRDHYTSGPRKDGSLADHRAAFRETIERSAGDWRATIRAPWRSEELK